MPTKRHKTVTILTPSPSERITDAGLSNDYFSFPFRPPATPATSGIASIVVPHADAYGCTSTAAATAIVTSPADLMASWSSETRPGVSIRLFSPAAILHHRRVWADEPTAFPPAGIEAFNSLRRRARKAARLRTKSYDDEFEGNREGAATPSNGLRVWYESYTTIDWVHDAIKESARLRRLQGIKGLRGFIINSWDRFQGWLIVGITGLITSIIAGAIIESEALLFDLKDGYCSTGWWHAKRFCCPLEDGEEALSPSHSDGATGLHRWAIAMYAHRPSAPASVDRRSAAVFSGVGPVAGSPQWETLASSDKEMQVCPRWVQWTDLLPNAVRKQGLAGFLFYLVIALLWASIACLLTLYLTSSDLHLSTRALESGKKGGQEQTGTEADPIGEDNPAREDAAVRDYAAPASERTSLLSRNVDEQSHYSATNDGDRPLPLRPKHFADLTNHTRAQGAIGSRKVLFFGSGSGISEVKCILSGFVIRGYLGFWTLFTKSVGLALSVASGLCLGKEGPFVHIASCVGNIVCRFFDKYERNETKRREILSCACAAGVAVAFGAPIGGILFSLEETTYYWSGKVMFRSFACAIIAAAGLRFINPFGTGEIVLFRVSYDKDWAWQELPIYVILGLFGGLYGAFFTKLNIIWSKQVRAKTWMARYPLLEVMLVTTLTIIVSFIIGGYARMGGPELINDLFSECHEHESLDGLCISHPSQIRPLIMAVFWTMLAKAVLTTVTFGIKLPAGIFIPSLAVGACFGRITGLLMQYIQWTQPHLAFFSWCSASDSACIIPGTYSMLGAAATLSGVTRSTVSLAVIMFELTGTLTYAIPVAISILVARTVADSLQHQGIYDLVIEMSGLPFLDPKLTYTWKDVSVKDAMDTEVEVIRLDEANSVDSLQSKLARLALGLGYTDGGFPIVVPSEVEPPTRRGGKRRSGIRMVGYIAAQELEYGLSQLLRQQPDLNPLETICTFAHIPQANGNSEDEAMTDSLFLRSDEPQDFSRFVDQAPVTITSFSPLELVQQYFVRLGVRYLAVVDSRGHLKGVIFKKRWLAFLSTLEEHH